MDSMKASTIIFFALWSAILPSHTFALPQAPQLSTQGTADSVGQEFTSSFTHYTGCGANVNCNGGVTNAYSSSVLGPTIGTAAANTFIYFNGDASTANQFNQGNGCGQCWLLTPTANWGSGTGGQGFGTPVVVQVTNQCPDAGYCDNAPGQPNSMGMQVHFDLCGDNGLVDQFFGPGGGTKGQAGQLTGTAKRLPDCSGLTAGPFGSG